MKLFGKMFCKIADTNDTKRMATLTEAEGVTVVKDIPYAEGGTPARLLNVYRPTGVEGKLPVIVDIHGGGWWYGDKELNRFYDRWLALQGFAVVSFSYRLAFEVSFDEQVKDVFALYAKVAELADEYGFDLNNAFLTGDSAGGHLAALTVNIMASKERQELFGVKPTLNFRAVNFTCGALAPSKMMFFGAGLYFREIVGKGYKRSPYFKALDFDTSLPTPMIPCTLISGRDDFLHKFTLSYYEELKAKGADCKLFFLSEPIVEGDTLEHVYNILYPDHEEAKKVNGGMVEFFKAHLN